MKSKKFNVPATFLISILVFLWIYNISFLVAPSISTGRLVAFLLIISMPISFLTLALRPHKYGFIYVFIVFLCLFWSFILWFSGDFEDSTQFSRFSHLIFYVWGSSVVFYVFSSRNIGIFLQWFSFATLMQSVFIYITFLDSNLRDFFSSTLVQGGNISLDAGYRVAGFSNSSGANLSLIQSFGVFSSLFCADFEHNRRKVFLWILVAFIIFSSTIFVGRTGLLVGLIFIFSYFVRWIFCSNMRFIMLAVWFCICMSAAFLVYIFLHKYIFLVGADRILSWAFEFAMDGGGSHSVRSLLNMTIPPISTETMIGTGLVSIDSGNASGHDSGYVQTYYSLGFIFALIFYFSSFLFFIYWVLRSKYKFHFFILLVILFAVEVKEPFIFKYTGMFLLFLFFLDSADRRRLEKSI